MSLLRAIDDIKEEIANKTVQKREEYLRYINEHIENVKRAYDIFVSIDWDESIISHDDLVLLGDRIKRHDESKYSDEEFEGFRMHFHSINEKEKQEHQEEYDEAWKHHYMTNDHHPEHWVHDGIVEEMSITAIAEMICDWQAMSFKYGGTCLSWYNTIKGTDDDKNLHPNTRDKLEDMMTIYERKLTEGQ